MKKSLCILWFIFILPGFISAEDLQISLNQLLNTDEGEERENLIEEILKINPSADTLITLLKNFTFDEPEKKGIVLSENLCKDGKNAPFAGAFIIYIHPDMVRLNQNVVIYENDELVYDDKVEQDIEFMLRNFLENRDRELIYINRITIKL